MKDLLGQCDYENEFLKIFKNYIKYIYEGFSIAKDKSQGISFGVENPDLLEEASIEINTILYKAKLKKNAVKKATLVLLDIFDLKQLQQIKSIEAKNEIYQPNILGNNKVILGKVVVPDFREDTYKGLTDHSLWMAENAIDVDVIYISDLPKVSSNFSSMLILTMNNNDEYFYPVTFYNIDRFSILSRLNNEKEEYISYLIGGINDYASPLNATIKGVDIKLLPHRPHCSLLTTKLMELKNKYFYKDAIFLSAYDANQLYHS